MKSKLTFKKIMRIGALAAIASTVINSILFYLFHAAGIITDNIEIQPGQPMTIVPIILSSVVASLFGACVYYPFERFSKNGLKIFSIVAIIMLLLSMGNPFVGIPKVTTGYALALDLMHFPVAFFLLFFLKQAKK